MSPQVLRIDHRDTPCGASVVSVDDVDDGRVELVDRDVATLAGLPERLAGSSPPGRRVVVDCRVGDDGEDPTGALVAAVWALGCGADVVTNQPRAVTLASAVLPPAGPVRRW